MACLKSLSILHLMNFLCIKSYNMHIQKKREKKKKKEKNEEKKDNVQYWLKGPMKVLLQTGEETVLTKGVYTEKELNAILGPGLKSQMVFHDDVLGTNKLEKVTKIVISLNELDNSNNLQDGRPSNTLFMYYVTGSEYSMRFKPCTPQYKALKNGMITSLTMKITDQANNIIADGLGTTVVLHIN